METHQKIPTAQRISNYLHPILTILQRLTQRPWSARFQRLRREGLLYYYASCASLAISGCFAFDAADTAGARASVSRAALFSEHEPYRGELYPGISAALSASIRTTDLDDMSSESPWRISCDAPDALLAFSNMSARLQHTETVTPFRAPRVLARLAANRVYVHIPRTIPSSRADIGTLAYAATLAEDAYSPEPVPFFSDDNINATASTLVGTYVTMLDGSLSLRPPPPLGAISAYRAFNNTSYFQNAIENSSSAALKCQSSKYPLYTETRPYLDLTGNGFLATICTPLGHPVAAVFCADVRLPLESIATSLARQRLADLAIVKMRFNSDALPRKCPSTLCDSMNLGLHLSYRDRDRIRSNVVPALLKDIVFKAGDTSTYYISLGTRHDGDTQEVELLVIRPPTMTSSIGLSLALAAAFLILAALLLIPPVKQVERRGMTDLIRVLQTGLVRTRFALPRRSRIRFHGDMHDKISTLAHQALLDQLQLETDFSKGFKTSARAASEAALSEAISVVASDVHAFEIIDQANGIATCLLGSRAGDQASGAVPGSVIVVRTRDGFRRSTYAEVQAMRFRGRASEYYFRKGPVWHRLIGAPIRMPDNSLETFAVIEPAAIEIVDKLNDAARTLT